MLQQRLSPTCNCISGSETHAAVVLQTWRSHLRSRATCLVYVLDEGLPNLICWIKLAMVCFRKSFWGLAHGMPGPSCEPSCSMLVALKLVYGCILKACRMPRDRASHISGLLPRAVTTVTEMSLDGKASITARHGATKSIMSAGIALNT